MFHPGKIIRIYSHSDPNVISSDDSTQATVIMWDKNLLTLEADRKIVPSLSVGSIVLVDYSPLSDTSPVPRHRIVKVLKGELAEDIWAEYDNYLKARSGNKGDNPSMPSLGTPRYFR